MSTRDSHRVLIVVTHLLGTGHLARALGLARGFAAAGDEVVLASGGMPVPHMDMSGVTLVQLPPLRSDGTDFARLLDETGTPARPEVFEVRRAALRACVATLQPEIVITELFPFGRRGLKDEFTGLLAQAEALPQRPRIFASVRDILAPPSKPRKAAFAEDMIAAHYDGVLVHADPEVITLDASWPISDALKSKLRYTGFVAPCLPSVPEHTDGHGEILVSAGGGSVGDRLFDAALGAAAGSAHTWRLLVGGHDAQARIARLAQAAPRNALVEPARADFRVLLQRCVASISLAGYNTAMDVLQTGIPAVMVAFDDGAEVEQTLRAGALARLPRLETVGLAEVTTQTLSDALTRVLSDPTPRDTGLRFDGGARTREICLAGVS